MSAPADNTARNIVRFPRALHPVDSPARAGSLADEVESAAARYYEAGFHCGESVLRAINDVAPSPLPVESLRLASGFCEGFGGSRCVCGALAGAVMGVGLLAGREHNTDAWEPTYYASGELNARWVAHEEASSCEQVAERYGGMRHPQRWAHCTELCGSCARWVVEIAEENGWL